MSFVGRILSGAIIICGCVLPGRGADVQTTVTATPAAAGVTACEALPTGELSDDELAKLVPDNSAGKVRIRWRVETQEDNYGYNILRCDTPEGTYAKVNKSIIAGQGSTNIPMDYCYEDRSVTRGQTYFYYIESISTAGVREIVEGTKGTKVKVKTVEEERAWLKAKAAGQDTATSGTSAAGAHAGAGATSASK
jgi:hypothetical protein